MSISEIVQGIGPGAVSRRAILSILPAGVAGCSGCVAAMAGEQPAQLEPASHSWTEKADVTWEEVFRFAYQKDLIPMLKELAARVGREELCGMLRQACDDVVRKKTAGRPPMVRDLVSFGANMQNNLPPLMQHAIEAEIVEQTAEAFEYRVKKCLWAKVFRDGDAGDIGYAMVCYPDFAVAKGLNPKLTLIRTQTLMQGNDSCLLRYVMEA